jgi:hypothetical protein
VQVIAAALVMQDTNAPGGVLSTTRVRGRIGKDPEAAEVVGSAAVAVVLPIAVHAVSVDRLTICIAWKPPPLEGDNGADATLVPVMRSV